MSDSDIRITPDPLWDIVKAFAGDRLICDVATEKSNPLGAARFFTKRDNALTNLWASSSQEVFRWLYWCNTPYSRGQVIQFADACVRWAALGLEVLLLTQADVTTDWYEFVRLNADARCHLDRRVAFLKPGGRGKFVKTQGAKFGSQVAYWGPRRRRFARIFGEHGEIIHGLGPQEEA